MLWQFGELGYDFSIDYNGRTGNKPIPWGDKDGLNYHKDPDRVKLYKATAAIIHLVNKYSHVFEGGEFSWTPTGQLRKINVSHANMNVTIVGNFGVTQGSIQPGFQHTGTWYDYFSGKAITVASTSEAKTLAPGEFHIYVDKAIEFPESGLIKDNTPIVIAVPGNLTAHAQGVTSITLTWMDTSTGETGYIVERKSDEQPIFEMLATLNEDVYEYTDKQIVDGISYEYRVKTTSTSKPHSDWSNTAMIDLPLLAPAGLKANVTNLRSVVLTWEDRSAHEQVYVVEKATQSGKSMTAFSVVTELKANATTFTDTKVQPGLLYYYRVVAKDSDEASAYSNQISVRPAVELLSSLKDKLTKCLSMFPNPAFDVLTISTIMELSEPMKVQIANLQGLVVKTFDITSGMSAGMQLNVSSWKEGIYVVQVTYQNITVRQLLMIKR
jgi:hypothetical protein